MFAFFALAVLSEAGQRLFMAQYGQPIQANRDAQVVYYADTGVAPMQQVYYVDPAVPQYRVAGPVMSAVTERDADGNPVTHTEMFDPVYYGIVFVICLIGLVKTYNGA